MSAHGHTRSHRCFQTPSLSLFSSSEVALLIWCFHMIHHSDHYHQADHHSCIWDAAFHQYGLLTSTPLEINLCILINHTLLMQHPSLMRCGQDRDRCKRCLVDLVTIHVALQHLSAHTPTLKHKTCTDNILKQLELVMSFFTHEWFHTVHRQSSDLPRVTWVQPET